MSTDCINLDLLFDAEEYRRQGHCPWTFFAYPRKLAVDHGLPPDADACRLLGEIQTRGIDVAIWINGIANDTTYFACRHEDIQNLNDSLEELRRNGSFPENFCEQRSERLFRQLEDQKGNES